MCVLVCVAPAIELLIGSCLDRKKTKGNLRMNKTKKTNHAPAANEALKLKG